MNVQGAYLLKKKKIRCNVGTLATFPLSYELRPSEQLEGSYAHHYATSPAKGPQNILFVFRGSYGIMVNSRDSRARLTNLGSKLAQSSLVM